MTHNKPDLDPQRLRVGQAFVLPSGSVVELRTRSGAEWECEYTVSLFSRGMVTLSRTFLLTRCKRV